jgi:hypothetical protein
MFGYVSQEEDRDIRQDECVLYFLIGYPGSSHSILQCEPIFHEPLLFFPIKGKLSDTKRQHGKFGKRVYLG